MFDYTRLRYICSKTPADLIKYINNLPYKVEIKGNPVLFKGKMYLYFVLPESDLVKEIASGDLD